MDRLSSIIRGYRGTGQRQKRMWKLPKFTIQRRFIQPIILKRHHGNHSHSHRQHEPPSKEGSRITLLGLLTNVSLTGVKGICGVAWNSSSLMAEALHSLSDLISDFVTLYSFKLARTKANQLYPYGYGKLEPLGGTIVSGLLMTGGIGMGLHSVHALIDFMSDESQVSSIPLHDYSLLVAFSPFAVLILVGSIGVKEWLYRKTLQIGQKEGSSVLIANAYHHRSDVYTSIVALVGVGGAALGIPMLDPLGGILVSAMIFKMGLESGIPSIKELTDMSISREWMELVEKELKEIQKDENIMGFHSVRARKMGPFIHIDLQLIVNPRISVSHAHQLAENTRHALISHVKGVNEVIIHVDSEEHDHSFHPQSTPSTSKIQQELIEWALDGSRNQVKSVSHATFHFLNDGKVEVVMEIVLRTSDMTLKDAFKIARSIQDKLAQHPKVVKSDVHLETQEDH